MSLTIYFSSEHNSEGTNVHLVPRTDFLYADNTTFPSKNIQMYSKH